MTFVDDALGKIIYTLEIFESAPHGQISSAEVVLDRPAGNRAVPIARFSSRACHGWQVV